MNFLCCLPEMDDSLTYAGIERELIARCIQQKVEMVLKELRRHLLQSGVGKMPTDVTIKTPCTVMRYERHAVIEAIQQYGWLCRFGDGDIAFSKWHPQQ